MSERMSSRHYDDLAKAVWALAKVAMPRAIQIAPLPCLVRRELDVDGQLVELSVEVTKPNEHISAELPRTLQMVMGRVEPYGPDDRYKLWSFEQLTLQPSRRTRTFEKGHQVFSADESVLMLPNTQGLPAGERRRLGPLAWREIKTSTSFSDFGPADADRFRAEAERLALRVREFDF